jgi:hypothetical protein
MGSMMALQILNLSFCWRIHCGAVCEVIERCGKSLKEVYLNECSELVGGALLALANSCPDLQSLCIYNCEKINPASIITLIGQCKKLVCLDLGHCQVDGKIMKAIGENCPNLQYEIFKTLSDFKKTFAEWLPDRCQSSGLYQSNSMHLPYVSGIAIIDEESSTFQSIPLQEHH